MMVFNFSYLKWGLSVWSITLIFLIVIFFLFLSLWKSKWLNKKPLLIKTALSSGISMTFFIGTLIILGELFFNNNLSSPLETIFLLFIVFIIFSVIGAFIWLMSKVIAKYIYLR